MDEVIADSLGEHLRRYNEEFDATVGKQDLTGKWLWDVVDLDHRDRVQAYFEEQDFFTDLEVLPGAIEVVRDLSRRYEIFIASAAMTFPSSLVPKFEWLQRHFPFLPQSHYVFCGDKSILLADYLIDDMPGNLRGFHGTGILFSAPHNQAEMGFVRVENWQEVADYFAGGA
jgi:5'-nucleotidase